MNEHGDSPDSAIEAEIAAIEKEIESEDDSAGDEINDAFTRANMIYKAESARFDRLAQFLSVHSIGIAREIDRNAIQGDSSDMNDNLSFARERALKSTYRALREIAGRSDLLAMAERALTLACPPVEQGEAE